MKNILIDNYDIPINKFISEMRATALQKKIELEKYVKEMNEFIEKMIELKEKNLEKEIFVIIENSQLKETYFSKNKDSIYFKFNKSYYEDRKTTTKLVFVNDGRYLALISDKKSKKIFIVDKNTTGIFCIYFYENNLLKRTVETYLRKNDHCLREIDINTLGYFSKTIKFSSNKMYFSAENSYVENIEKKIDEKSHYEVIFNKEKSDLERITLVDGEIKDCMLSSEAFRKLPPKMRDKIYKDKQIYKNNPNIFEEIVKYLKETADMDFLSQDKTQNIDIESLINKVKRIIDDKQKYFYNSNKNHQQLSEMINFFSEKIICYQRDFNSAEYEQSKKIEYKGISLIEHEGYDYKKIDYESFTFEEVNNIYNFISNELEISGHEEGHSVE